MKKDKILKVDRDVMFFAFRYALGRMTFAPVTVVENIKSNIENITTGDIEMYIREIEQCGNYGMECDSELWLDFLQYLKKEFYKRSEES